MEHWLWIILAALSFECKGQDTVTQPAGDVSATEGDTVTLDCTFHISVSLSAYLFWYKQEANDLLLFILRRDTYGTGDNAAEFKKDRFDATLNDKSVPLQISSAAVTDSAVYYCALNTGFGNKMIFGRGTRLTVETKEEYKPSFYKFKDNSTSLCLASGFSRLRAADKEKNNTFSNITGAVRINGDSLFNQVAYLSSEESGQCETEGGPVDCDDSLQPDPQVNLVSLTVLGLRLLFMKTVVFNVLLTLRLWITS